MKTLKTVLFFFFGIFALSTLQSCSKDDPCESITCQNGGTCVNGECDCPEGYTGPSCASEMAPSAIKIVGIALKEFPATTTNGASWDFTSGADVYVQLVYNGNVLYESDWQQNANPNGGTIWFPSGNLLMHSPQNEYTIQLYDYDDFDADDYIGGIRFIPYRPGRDFPSVITLDAGQGIAFELTVQYQF